jgi:pSer/pThr/pTyr-binding forkhead associated (FHA) protein
MSSDLYLDLVVEGAVVHRFALELGQQTLGRDRGCAIRVLDTSISGIHCLIELKPSPRVPGHIDVTVADMESTNGTSVNGVRIQKARLMIGDQLRCGDVSLVLNGADGLATTQTAISLGPDGV